MGVTREKSGRGQLLACSFSGCRGGRGPWFCCAWGRGFSGKPFTLSGGHVALGGASIIIAAVVATPASTFTRSLALRSVIYMYEFIPSFRSPPCGCYYYPFLPTGNGDSWAPSWLVRELQINAAVVCCDAAP